MEWNDLIERETHGDEVRVPSTAQWLYAIGLGETPQTMLICRQYQAKYTPIYTPTRVTSGRKHNYVSICGLYTQPHGSLTDIFPPHLVRV